MSRIIKNLGDFIPKDPDEKVLERLNLKYINDGFYTETSSEYHSVNMPNYPNSANNNEYKKSAEILHKIRKWIRKIIS